MTVLAQLEPAKTPSRASPRSGLVAAGIVLFGLSAFWTSIEPDSVLPKVFALIAVAPLLGVAIARAPAALIAVLLVGQAFVKSAPGISASRDSPVSVPILIIGAVLGVVFLARYARAGGKLPATLSGATGRVGRVLLFTAAALGLALLVNLPRSPLQVYGQRKVLGYLVFDLAPMAMLLVFVTSWRDIRQLAVALAVIGTLTALAAGLYGVITYRSLVGANGSLKFDQIEFYGLQVYGGVWLARRAALGAVCAAALAYTARGRRSYWIAVAAIAVDWWVILLTGRGPFIAFTFGLFAFLLMARGPSGRARSPRRRAMVVLALVFCAGIFAAVSASQGLQSQYQLSEARTEKYRALFYRDAFATFVGQPLIGVGTGGWRAGYEGPDQQERNLYPHNVVLELAAENGMLGLAPFLAMVGTAAVVGVRMCRSRWTSPEGRVWSAWALSSLVIFFLNSLVSGDVFRNELLWASVALVAVISTMERQNSALGPGLDNQHRRPAEGDYTAAVARAVRRRAGALSSPPVTILVGCPAHIAPRARFALEHLAASAFPASARPGDEVVLAYGEPAGTVPPSAIRIPCHPSAWTDVPDRPVLGRLEPDGPGAAVDSDIAATTFQAIARAHEAAVEQLDPLGRVPLAATPFGRGARSLLGPVVDDVVGMLQEGIIRAGRVASDVGPWDGKRFAIGLSHDVDALLRWTPRGYAVSGYRAVRSLRERRPAAAWDETRSALSRLAGPRAPDPYWTFEDILELERRYGAKSSFYFKTRFRNAADGADEATYFRRVREVVGMATDAGCEIGLHGSWGAAHGLPALTEEKEILERWTDKPVVGMRYHNLRFLPDTTPRLLEQAGFTYDTTVAFAEEVGFRSGSSFPHLLWDTRSEQPVGVTEVPLAIMDTSLLAERYGNMDHKQAWDMIVRVLEVVRRSGGAASVLFHNDLFGPGAGRGAGRLYADLLGWVAQHDGLLTTVGDIAERWERMAKAYRGPSSGGAPPSPAVDRRAARP